MDETSQASFDTVMAFMGAMNEGPDAMSPADHQSRKHRRHRLW